MGDFKIDISTIKIEKLKGLADMANVNSGTPEEAKYLDSEEITIFESLLEKCGPNSNVPDMLKLTEGEQISGLTIVRNAKKVTNPQEQKSPKEKRYDELASKFNKIIEANEQDKGAVNEYGGHNFKIYLKILKDELKSKKDSKGNKIEREWNKPYTKEAFEKLEYDVENAAQLQKIAATRSNYAGKNDVITEIGFKASDEAKAWQRVADRKKHAEKRDAQLSSISRDEMEEGLKLTAALGIIRVKKGSTVADKFNKFRKDDGTYDLTAVLNGYTTKDGRRIKGLASFWGADATANWSVDNGKHGQSEVDNIQRQLYKLTGNTFNEFETRKVIDFLGRFYQHRSHRIDVAFYGDSKKESDRVAAEAIVSAGGGLIFPKIVQESIVKVSQEKAASALAQLGSAAVYAGTDENGLALIKVLQEVDIRGLVALGCMIAGPVLETGLKALFGTMITERTCFNNGKAMNYINSLSEFKAFIEEEYAGEPEKADAIMTMAQGYVNTYGKEKGESGALLMMLQKISEFVGGEGSTVGYEECIGAMLDMDKEKTPPPTTPPTKKCKPEKVKGKEFKFEPQRQDIRSWREAVNGYSCLNKYKNIVIKGKDLDIRMLKVIQAMDTSNVKTQEDARTFYNIQEIAKFAEDAIRLGIDGAIRENPDFPINKAEYLSVLSAKDLDRKNGTYAPTLYDSEQNDTCDWTSKGRVKQKQGGDGSQPSIGDKSRVYKKDDEYYLSCPDGSRTKIKKEKFLELGGKDD